MPRKTRKKLVGRIEDVERTARAKSLRSLERELHLEWQRQAADANEPDDGQTPTDEGQVNK